jgi:ribosomal protein S18 acetylase RimI-like enzyme
LGERPGGAALEIALKECDFAYARLPTTETRAVGFLEQLGFRVVDTALGFECLASDIIDGTEATARFAVPADRGQIEEIAGTAFRYSRFHLDPAVSMDEANKIKRNWAANFFAGQRGDAMIVGELGGRIAGFLQVLANESFCTIDLIATAQGYERRGIARGMIAFLAKHGDGRRPPARIAVGTQAANVPSCRLYECSGFRLTKSEFILHYHRQA